MSAKRDYYDVLGISRNADESQIKKAYRKLAKQYHPDTNSGNADAEQKFKEVTEAYDVLGNKEKRKMYDQFGHAAFDQAAGAGTGTDAGYGGPGRGFWRTYSSGGKNGSYKEYHFNGDEDDIFGDIFGDIFHHGAGDFGRETIQRRGSDIHAEVTVGFDEAVFGCDKVIRLQDPAGAGDRIQSLQVHIPAGIDTGKSVRLKGKGMPGINGGEAGDLLLKVTVACKPGYERKGMDVYTTVNIPYTTAVFGGEAVVSTLYGNVICKIREGTQSGTKIRLRGKGIVSMKNPAVHGDQYVTVQISVPKNLSPQEKQKLREYEEVCAGSARTA